MIAFVTLTMYLVNFPPNQKQNVAMTAITIRTLHMTPPAIVPALVPPIVPPIVPALSVGFRVGGARVGDGVTVEAVEERYTRNNIFVLRQSQ